MAGGKSVERAILMLRPAFAKPASAGEGRQAQHEVQIARLMVLVLSLSKDEDCWV